MGKRGYDPKEKQSSTISNRQVLELMAHYQFAVQRVATPVEAKASVRKAVNDAKRQFGEYAAISASGESVLFMGEHVETHHPVRDIRVKLSHMLGIGEQKELYKLTGIPELKPNRE